MRKGLIVTEIVPTRPLLSTRKRKNQGRVHVGRARVIRRNVQHGEEKSEYANNEEGESSEDDELDVPILEADVERVLRKIRNDIRSSHKRIMDVFLSADEDQSGTLDPQEIKHALRKINCMLDDVELKHLMAYLDTDGDGEIDYHEFSTKLNASDPQRLKEIKKRLGPSPEEKMNMKVNELNDNALERVSTYAAHIRTHSWQPKGKDEMLSHEIGKEAIRIIRDFMRKYKLRTQDMINNIDKNRDGLVDADELHSAVISIRSKSNVPKEAISAFISNLSPFVGKLTRKMFYASLYATDDAFQRGMVKRMPCDSRERHSASSSSLPSLDNANERDALDDPKLLPLAQVYYSTNDDVWPASWGHRGKHHKHTLRTGQSHAPASAEGRTATMTIEEQIQSLRAEIQASLQRRSEPKEFCEVESNLRKPRESTHNPPSWRTSTDDEVLNSLFQNEIGECDKLLDIVKYRKSVELTAWETYWEDVGHGAARKIQNGFRSKLARDIVNRVKKDRASVVIQKMYRCKQARRELRLRKAILLIQRVYRGRLSRVKTAVQLAKDKASVIIVQKCVRRTLTQMKARLLKAKRDERMRVIKQQHIERLSARRIQRSFREYRKRMQGYRFRIVVQAARAKKIEETTRRFEEGAYDEEIIGEMIGMEGRINAAGFRTENVGKRKTSQE